MAVDHRKMEEFRFHGRGGQGVVVLSKLVAHLFFHAGKQVKEFPKFGVERRGAPVEGYVRVDDAAIDLACQVYHPTAIVVMAETILDNVDVTRGMQPGALVLVDSAQPASGLAVRLAGFRVATVDATRIALELGLGTPLRPISNTSLFGAMARILGFTKEEVEAAIRAEIKKPEININAAAAAFDTVTEPVLLAGEPRVAPAPPALFRYLEEIPPTGYSLRDARFNKTGSWRTQRPRYTFKIAPCDAHCPAGNDIRGFLTALADGEPAEALAILLRTTPLPGVCGRVCPHPCESSCNRAGLDGTLPIMALERYAEAHGGDLPSTSAPATGKRVAIVGAGPAGLSAAWQLARRGHRVVVFDAAPHPGGMLLLGIPSYRLPRDVITREVARLLRLGVELRCNTAVGRDVDLAELSDEHDAVLIAVGQQVSSALGLPGEDGPGVLHGLFFLRRHNLGAEVEVGERVVVIGGGNTAMDVAGVCRRHAKSRQVTIVYRRSRAEMPAIAEEIDQVLAAGVELVELTAPVDFNRNSAGELTGLVCERMRLEPSPGGGRPRPVPVPGSRHEIPCDQVMLAIGQRTDLAFAGDLEVAADTVTTNVDGLYVCGDANTGAGTVTAAIGSGREAALAIHRALGGETDAEPVTWAPRQPEVLGPERINRDYFPRRPGAEPPHLSFAEQVAGFAEVVGEIPNGIDEAQRCMSCGTCTACDTCRIYCPEPAIVTRDGQYSIDLEYCKGCGVCFQECPRGIIDMVVEEKG